jgi:hypothetical protein
VQGADSYKALYVRLHHSQAARLPLIRFRAVSTDGGVDASARYWVRTACKLMLFRSAMQTEPTREAVVGSEASLLKACACNGAARGISM